MYSNDNMNYIRIANVLCWDEKGWRKSLNRVEVSWKWIRSGHLNFGQKWK